MVLRALIFDDDPADAELVRRELARVRDVAARIAVSPEQARAALADERWDIVVAEWSMPGSGAHPVLEIVRELGLAVPVIAVSRVIGEDVAVSAMRAGARDLVFKDRLYRLAPAVERELREADTRVARRRAEAELHDAAARYRDLFDSSPLPMWVYDTQTLRFLAVNRAAQRRYGYTHDEFLALARRSAAGRGPRAAARGRRAAR